MIRILFTVLTTFLLAGCPQSDPSAGPVDTCEKAGQQCRLGGGQLGVCSAGADGQLECVSQH